MARLVDQSAVSPGSQLGAGRLRPGNAAERAGELPVRDLHPVRGLCEGAVGVLGDGVRVFGVE